MILCPYFRVKMRWNSSFNHQLALRAFCILVSFLKPCCGDDVCLGRLSIQDRWVESQKILLGYSNTPKVSIDTHAHISSNLEDKYNITAFQILDKYGGIVYPRNTKLVWRSPASTPWTRAIATLTFFPCALKEEENWSFCYYYFARTKKKKGGAGWEESDNSFATVRSPKTT